MNINKYNKDINTHVSGQKWYATHRVHISHRNKIGEKYVPMISMKTMLPLGYHCNGFVATHTLGHMIYGQ